MPAVRRGKATTHKGAHCIIAIAGGGLAQAPGADMVGHAAGSLDRGEC